MAPRTKTRWPRGGPIAMLALVLGGWVSARAMMWHNPFAPVEPALAHSASVSLAGADTGPRHASVPSPSLSANGVQGWPVPPEAAAFRRSALVPVIPAYAAPSQRAAVPAADPVPASRPPAAASPPQADPPFVPAAPSRAARIRPERWSLDAWAFWRQGSQAAPISQGRVPIYGASQIGAVLQYRIAPASARDPRLYARAYRAMVRRGEEELAVGASVRPLAQVPVRVAGELRLTDAAFRNEARPSVYAVTELAPARLPHGVRLEAYGQAGWVGGTDATAFADGQASVTRDVGVVAARSNDRVRLTIGAGAWGGAQEGAHRIDVGPTVRVDMTLADTPLRLSVDWRERVAGQAAPGSGLAATLSTRF